MKFLKLVKEKIGNDKFNYKSDPEFYAQKRISRIYEIIKIDAKKAQEDYDDLTWHGEIEKEQKSMILFLMK